MIVRGALALSAVLVSGVWLAPTHAVAPACRLLSDGPGDGQIQGAGPNVPAIDIVSGDVATGSKNLVGVLRLASLASDPTTSGGAIYTLGWSVGGVPQRLTFVIAAGGGTSATFRADNSFGSKAPEVAVTAAMDRTANSLIWTMPRKLNPKLPLAAKAKSPQLSSFTATAQVATVINAEDTHFSFSFLNGDDAESHKTYLDRSASCVKGT